ncbi:EscU/YscU/HrcU family type III secretion system export apparatus switch protein [Sphingomonas solaris]|uniref:Flagellar biosynthesis protein FlhB n=1 Tax=Alterirhizorhabdus solaris TaxID=2529389 RepID=A0A558R1E1_9SPHN|nr:flagellar type III secretion system protein FlhB [Sphingomonas solaris]TVV73179.1 flagellar biosynthesis protein FlhB [Sphingomonas solaris]
MAESEGGEKTEDPTDKRKRDAVEKGDVLQSKDLGTAMVVLGGAAWMVLAGPWLVGALRDMLADGLRFDANSLRTFDPAEAFWRLGAAVVMPLATLFAITLVAAIGTPAILGSLGFRWSAMGFKPDKMNPISGLGRMFGLNGLMELGKSIAKVALLGGVAWWLLAGQADRLVTLGQQDLVAALGDLGQSFVMAVLVMALALALIAGVDIPTQIIRRGGRLRMSKQEVKDEHKQSEGSPELKAQIRRRQHEVLKGSARQAVSDATVVLTNPTHFAVALRYRPGVDAAPTVVARGRGATADAIRELADELAVPMLGYPQLARALYFTTRTGQVIRDDLYLAVATVIAFVFNLDAAMAGGTDMPVRPDIDVPKGARFDEDGHPDG